MNVPVVDSLRFAALTGALVFVLLSFGVPSSSASGPFSGKNSKIAVVANNPDGASLDIVSPRGSLRSLYEEFDYNLAGSELSFSPSGSKIIASLGWRPSSPAVFGVSAGRRSLDLGGQEFDNPIWADNGRIVFNSPGKYSDPGTSGKSTGTFSMRPNGKGRHRLSKRQYLASSPNLRKFVGGYRTYKTHSLKLFNRKGRFLRTLAADKRAFFANPRFSPDGRWIVYTKYPPVDRLGQWDDYQGNLYVIRSNGTGHRRLTSGNRDRYPTFSPDGRWIAFSHHKRGETAFQSYYSNIAVVRLNRPGKLRRVTRITKTNFSALGWGRR